MITADERLARLTQAMTMRHKMFSRQISLLSPPSNDDAVSVKLLHTSLAARVNELKNLLDLTAKLEKML